MRYILVLVALALAACVSSSKYDTLREELDATKSTLNGRITDLEGQLKAKDKELADARSQHDQDTGRVKQLEADKAKLEADLTTLRAEAGRLAVDKAKLEAELAATVKDRAALKSSAEELARALAESNSRKAEAEKRIAEMKQLLGRLKSMIDAGKLKVKIVDGRMVLELATDVLFASGSAELSPTGLATINQVATVLVTLPRKLQVEGHTDNVPIHTARFPSNWELGAARAITIVDTMIAAGMSPSQLSAASYGEFKPVGSNDSDPGRAQNRRIEIVIVPDLSMLPGFDELQKTLGS